MDKLTDEQLKVLGTAIGAEIVRSFSAKQEYWYNTSGWLSKLITVFCDRLTENLAAQLQYNSKLFVSIGKKIFHKDSHD